MTCIVAFRTSKGVIMGADSCAGNGYHASSKTEPKVKAVGEYLFGSCGSMRVGQVVTHALSTSKYNEKNDFYWHVVNVLVPEIRQAMKNSGCLIVKDGEESIGSEFLIGHGRRLLVMQSDFSVCEYEDDFIATGCGEDWAMGAMYALRNNKQLSVKDKLTTALEASTKYSSYVRGPYHFVQNFEETKQARRR